MKNLVHDNIEEVFFNYYEGNMSEDEKVALFSFLDKNPSLYQDFTFWKDSYVHEPLPMVEALEKRLIKQEKASYRIEKSILYKLLVLVGVGALLWWSISDKDSNHKVNRLPETLEKVDAPAILSPQHRKNELGAKQINPRGKKSPSILTLIDKEYEPVETKDSMPSNSGVSKDEAINVLSTPLIDTAGLVDPASPNQEQNAAQHSEPQSTHLTKKELRQIERTKARAKNLRREQEFLKGDQPYVVPIDPNRF
jgi:hypothetical protein